MKRFVIIVYMNRAIERRAGKYYIDGKRIDDTTLSIIKDKIKRGLI